LTPGKKEATLELILMYNGNLLIPPEGEQKEGGLDSS
jgi:hypothetical protein